MVDYDTENGTDPNDVHTKASQIKLEYNAGHVEFWFNQLEAKMRFAGIQSQWTKLQVVITLIPQSVAEEIKHLLRVSSQANASETCYKDVKKEIIELFGRQEEDTFELASQLVLTTTPSALMKKIIDICCPTHPKLQGCCSAALITGIWKAKLPQIVRSAIAGQTTKNGNFDNLIKLADAVHKASQPKSTPTVAAATAAAQGPDTIPHIPTGAEIAAMQRARANAQNSKKPKGYQGGQNRNQGATGGATAQPRKKRSPDNPPDDACARHWQFGKSAWNCLQPRKCPWRHFITPPPNST